jgi:hypothetical protein
MTHRNKGKRKREDKQAKKAAQQQQVDRQRDENVIEHSAAVLSCATEAADEIAGVCDHLLEELAVELPYLRLALEIWKEHPELAQPLQSVLVELQDASVAYNELLHKAGQQLQRLAADPAPHIHLEPRDRYRRLVRERLFPEAPAG